jgi:hypothetical protein
VTAQYSLKVKDVRLLRVLTEEGGKEIKVRKICQSNFHIFIQVTALRPMEVKDII